LLTIIIKVTKVLIIKEDPKARDQNYKQHYYHHHKSNQSSSNRRGSQGCS
jgi:hypothetical protein